MGRNELQDLLNAGIEAIRRGDRATGRDLLLRVVAADERIEPAWFWLSGAVDDPADKLIALENVLALNPKHTQAEAGARALREQLGLLPAAHRDEPAAGQTPDGASQGERVAPDKPAVVSLTHSYFAAQLEEDPFQCAYCGRPVEADATGCPHCGRGLLVVGPWSAGGYLYLALLFSGVHMQWALLQAMLAYAHLNFARASIIPGLDTWAANLLAPAVIRAGVWVVVVILTLYEVKWVYRMLLVVAALDLLWNLGGYTLGVLGQLLVAANSILAGAVLLVALAALIGQSQARVRLRVVLDRNLRGSLHFDQHAENYAREGKWALALLHWRRAIGLHPRFAGYHMKLGNALVHLGRQQDALKAYNSGAELDPTDLELARLVDELKESMPSG